jgi:UDP-N-acetylmuramoyl-tripeptide--D-alanyl-D-alanine ligase
MRSALESFFSAKFRKRGLVLGDMLELGSYSEQEHNDIIEYLKTQKVDDLWLVGSEFSKTPKLGFAKYYNSVNEMKVDFLKNKKMGFTYLIKGSRGLKLEELLK